MKTKLIKIFLSLMLCGVLSPSVSAEDGNGVEIVPNAFAVVELYTSQGCSSCPPADQMFNTLTQLAKKGNKPIYTLAFHVDYWDYLGWKDPFAHNVYTKRQRDYARWNNQRSLYTPQMIVNGTEQFRGYNNVKAVESINESLIKPADVLIGLKLFVKNDQVSIDYKLSRKLDNTMLNFAIVESDLATDVLRGENAGQTLRHDNVVRGFSTLDTYEKKGRLHFKIPDHLKKENAAVIAFVQDMNTLQIIGAAQKVWP